MTQTSQSPETTTQLQGFNDFVRTTMQDWKLPGLAIAIVKDGEVILSQGFGKRNVAQANRWCSRLRTTVTTSLRQPLNDLAYKRRSPSPPIPKGILIASPF